MHTWQNVLVVIKGGGDLASGVAYRLKRAGFPLVILEQERPTAIRRAVAFAQAVFDGQTTVEGVTALRVADAAEARRLLQGPRIPLLVDPEARSLPQLQPMVLVDATLCKREPTTRQGDAPFVVGLGPGFVVGVHAHAVVETQRGHSLGRVLWSGSATPDSGAPGLVGGKGAERVLRAPTAGPFRALQSIGQLVSAGEAVALVGDAPVTAPFAGVLRGLLAD
ncbi:MAG: EF2563 family selenium-dependent molybdenum hydroxylase system protein, partial [Chloroflexi bacterium]|nr:EF2563 family selenium-dependent molybdenum hydroxylase system protein [Chloroflexota bacterium]